MKGVTLSIWMWIVGGLIMGGLIFVGSFYNLTAIGEQVTIQNTQSEFNSINNDISFVCGRAEGTERSREITLHQVRALYSAETIRESPDESPLFVSEEESSSGEHYCIDFEGPNYECVEHDCNIESNYIGEPLAGSDMYQLGEGGGWSFDLTISKEGDNVKIESTHLP